MTLDDDVALLTLVSHKLDVLLVTAIGKLHIERKRNAVAELCREVEAYHIVRFLDALTAAAASQGVLTELRALTLEKISKVDAEAEGTVVKKGYAEIAVACLALLVLLDGDTGARCHLLHGKSRNDM